MRILQIEWIVQIEWTQIEQINADKNKTRITREKTDKYG